MVYDEMSQCQDILRYCPSLGHNRSFCTSPVVQTLTLALLLPWLVTSMAGICRHRRGLRNFLAPLMPL